MSHEQSETIQAGSGFRNVYGQGVGERAGMPIPQEHAFEKTVYPNLQEELGAAITRSAIHGQRHPEIEAPEPVSGAPAGTPYRVINDTLDPVYKDWSQKYRNATSMLEDIRLQKSEEDVRKLKEEGSLPAKALSTILDVLSMPQEYMLGLLKGQAGNRLTIQQFIEQEVPGGTNLAIQELRKKDYDDSFIQAVLGAQVFMLGVAMDPLNAVGPAVKGAKAVAQGAKALVKGGKTGATAADTMKNLNIVVPETHFVPDEASVKIQELAQQLDESHAASTNPTAKAQRTKDTRGEIQRIIDEQVVAKKDLANDPQLQRKAVELESDPVFSTLLGEEGMAQMPLMLGITRATIGGTIGAMTGDEEDRLRNVMIGAGLGTFATPSVVRRLVSVFQDDPKLSKGFSDPAILAAAQLGKAEKAMPTSELSAMYQADRDAFTASRSVKTVKEDADLMEKYGHVTEEGILKLQPGAILNDSEKLALVNVATKAAIRLKQMSETADVTKPETIQEFYRQLYRLGQLDVRRLGTAAEEGRVLRMEQEIQGEKAFLDQFTGVMSRLKIGQSPQRMMQLVNSTEDLDHLTAFAKHVTRPKFWDMAAEVWINGLLSGAKTMTTNTIGNGAFFLWNIGERGLSRLYSNNVVPGEAWAMLSSAVSSFEDAAKLAWYSFKQEDGEIPMALAKKMGRTGASKLESPVRAVTTENINDLAFMRKLGMKIDETGTMGRAVDWMGSWMVRLPGRVLLSTDEFFKGIAFRAEISAQAHREAFREVAAQGLTGEKAAEVFARTIKRIESELPDDLADKAKSFAAYTTFTKELGSAGKALQELSAASPMARIILPFVRAPINLFKAGLLERTPLGLMVPEIRRTIQKGGAEADLAMTRMAAGSMMLSSFMGMAAAGYLTGSGPSDPIEKENWKQAGFQAHSLNVSKMGRAMSGHPDGDEKPRPGDEFIQLDRIEPLGMILGMAGDMAEVWGRLSDDDRDATAAAAVVATAFSKNFASKTFVHGVAEFTTAAGDPDRFMKRLVLHEAGTLVPGSAAIAGVTREIDPTIRDAQTWIEAMKARVYPFSKDVSPDRDIFGYPKTYSPGLGPDIASPFYSSKYKGHPVLDALVEDKARIAPIGRNMDGIHLPMDLYDRLQVLAGHEVTDEMGRTYEEAMADVIKTAEQYDYPTGPDSWRAEEFRQVTRKFHTLARAALKAENEDLADAIMDKQTEHTNRQLPGGVTIGGR